MTLREQAIRLNVLELSRILLHGGPKKVRARATRVLNDILWQIENPNSTKRDGQQLSDPSGKNPRVEGNGY